MPARRKFCCCYRFTSCCCHLSTGDYSMNAECWNLVYVAGIAGLLVGGILAEAITRMAQKKPRKEVTSKHLPPSWAVQSTRTYLSWCNVTVCYACEIRGHRLDFPIENPCPGCGVQNSRSADPIRLETGRWDPGIKMWILKGEDLIMLRRQAD